MIGFLGPFQLDKLVEQERRAEEPKLTSLPEPELEHA
jgi:hypothetical protein